MKIEIIQSKTNPFFAFPPYMCPSPDQNKLKKPANQGALGLLNILTPFIN